MYIALLLSLVLSVHANDDIQQECPLDPESALTSGHCECTSRNLPYYKKRYMTCTDLEAVPSFVPDGQLYLRLQMIEQSIRELPEAAFRGLNVEELRMNHNPIGDNIHPRALAGLEDVLDTLEMNSCGLTMLPPGLLRGMNKLSRLLLENNRIANIPDGYFSGSRLSKLSLRHNVLSDLNRRSLKGLSSLVVLNLDHNKIHSISSNILAHSFNDLVFLRLNNNNIEMINAETFIHARNLKYLDLYANDISILYDNAFKGLQALETLSLADNKIHFLGSMLFSELEFLYVLDLSNNTIIHLGRGDFGGLGRVEILDLEHNRLTTIGPEVFSGLVNLESLYLSDNQLETMSHCSLPRSDDFRFVDLDNNNLLCDCRLAWIAQLKTNKTSMHIFSDRCADTEYFIYDPAVYEDLQCPDTHSCV